MTDSGRKPKLQGVIERYKAGKVAPHTYRTDGASRDPECGVRGCRWSWSDHLSAELLEIVKEAVKP